MNKTSVKSYLFTDNFTPDKNLFANIYNLIDRNKSENNILNYFVLNKDKEINKTLFKFINKYFILNLFSLGEYLNNTNNKYIKINKAKKFEARTLIKDRYIGNEPIYEDFQDKLVYIFDRINNKKSEVKSKNINEKLDVTITGESLNQTNNASISHTNIIKSSIMNGKNIGSVKFEIKKEDYEKNIQFELNSIFERKAYQSETTKSVKIILIF